MEGAARLDRLVVVTTAGEPHRWTLAPSGAAT